jgi:hypothetical protein
MRAVTRARALGVAALAGPSLVVASLVAGQSYETPPPNGLLSLGAAPVPDGERFRDPDLWIDRFGARLSLFDQTGRGWQSQATSDPRTPGSEAVFIANPVLYTHLTQRGGIQHDVYLPIDVLTSASTDALSAVTSASRDNESFTLDVTTTVDDGPDQRLLVRWGGHVEEELKSVNLGVGTSLDFADDNATLVLGFDALLDIFDPVQWNGVDLGLTQRLTLSLNGTFTQLLSESTTLTIAYGFTGQLGHIHTPWNSVPREGGSRAGDLFPATRMRHAATVRLAQGIDATRTFFNGAYRLYVDDYGVVAHSPEITGTQYLSDELWLRGQYRYHSQGAPFFFMTSFPETGRAYDYRTADSDLAALDLHEVSGSLRYFYDRHGQPSATSGWVELGYTYYRRSNSLEIHMGTIGFCTAMD